jgi:hypothetical protein
MRAAGDIQSGAGGFALVATSSLPIPGDFSTPAGRARLGFSAQDEAAMSGVSVYGLLVSPGENASCLNLAHPMAPKMLGVSHALIDRGGFGVDWQDLLKSDETAAFADADTGRWILDTDVGRKYEYRNGPVAASLRIRGLIPDSIFAGELLVSEDRFRRLFPDERTPRFFLIQTPTGHEDAVAAVLRQNLGVLGLDVRKSSDLLNAVASVQNTYISAFDALGGLGMLLGTGVLATMLLRRAAERRKELAILAALGFRQRSIAAILFYETAGLLVAGALWGAVCALVSITPYLTQSSAAPNWPVVCAITGMTTLVGAAGCYLAAISATHGSLVEALRSE